MRHVVGDSHADSFEGYPGYVPHHVGTYTAYSLIKGTDGGSKTIRVVESVPSGDTIIMAFGEIDCRVQIYNHYIGDSLYRSVEARISEVIDRYGKFLVQLGRDLMVLAVPPAGYEGNTAQVAHYGSPEIRSKIHSGFNEKLAGMCKASGFPFVSVYDQIVLPDGLADRRYLRDDTHLNHAGIALVDAEVSRLLGQQVKMQPEPLPASLEGSGDTVSGVKEE